MVFRNEAEKKVFKHPPSECKKPEEEEGHSMMTPPPSWVRGLGVAFDIPGFVRNTRQRLDDALTAEEGTQPGPSAAHSSSPTSGVKERTEAILAAFPLALWEDPSTVQKVTGAVVALVGKDDAKELLAERVASAVLEDDIEVASRVEVSTQMDGGNIDFTELEKLGDTTGVAAHGYSEQSHLSTEIVNRLKAQPEAWRDVENLRECLGVLAKALPTPAQRSSVKACATQLPDMIDVNGPSPPPPEVMRKACALCAKNPVFILDAIPVKVRVVDKAPAEEEEEEEAGPILQRMCDARTIYEFMLLKNDEVGGSAYLSGKLQALKMKYLTPKKGRNVSNQMKVAMRRADSVAQLLLPQSPDRIVIYEDAHKYHHGRGGVFEYKFYHNVDEAKLVKDSALARIHELELFKCDGQVRATSHRTPLVAMCHAASS